MGITMSLQSSVRLTVPAMQTAKQLLRGSQKDMEFMKSLLVTTYCMCNRFIKHSRVLSKLLYSTMVEKGFQKSSLNR